MAHITTITRNSNTKPSITTETRKLAKTILVVLHTEMDRIARQLLEYEIIRAMRGVGEKSAPQLMAEISDVYRFLRLKSIVGFASIDPAVDDSDKHISKSDPTIQRSSPHLRKKLYQIICT